MILTFDTFASNLARTRERIAKACAQIARNPESITILPITKSLPVTAVEYAVKSNLSRVGENQVQEVFRKKAELNSPITWELVGHLQSNKAKLAADIFTRVHSVDSQKLLGLLNGCAKNLGKSLSILIQVNTGSDPAKFGVTPQEAFRLVELALSASNLKVEGLMTVAPLSIDRTIPRRAFAGLRILRDQIETSLRVRLPALSMGMSGDFEDAIIEGSTILRLGTALFESRPTT